MFRYAHLDVNNKVIGVYFLSGVVNRPDYILSETAEIGQKYINGEFI